MAMLCKWTVRRCRRRLRRRWIKPSRRMSFVPASSTHLLTSLSLFSGRRKRPIPDGWATADTIQSFDSVQTSEALYPGSRTVAVDESGDLALFGGADGVA